jgi:hypothetical protein
MESVSSLRIIRLIFLAALTVSFASVIGGLIGWGDGPLISFIGLAAAILAAIAALAFSTVWDWEWRRAHPDHLPR